MHGVYHLQYDDLISLALDQARQAAALGEVPIGAVIVRGTDILAADFNRTETLHDPTAHAEMNVIRIATQKLANWRLTDCTLCVTLEPCVMCMGAIRLARIGRVIYGAKNQRFALSDGAQNVIDAPQLGPVPEIVSGVGEQECAELLKAFFRQRRERWPSG